MAYYDQEDKMARLRRWRAVGGTGVPPGMYEPFVEIIDRFHPISTGAIYLKKPKPSSTSSNSNVGRASPVSNKTFYGVVGGLLFATLVWGFFSNKPAIFFGPNEFKPAQNEVVSRPYPQPMPDQQPKRSYQTKQRQTNKLRIAPRIM